VWVCVRKISRDLGPPPQHSKALRGTFPMLYVAVTEIWRSMHENAARRIQLPHHHHSPHPESLSVPLHGNVKGAVLGNSGPFSLPCPVKSRYYAPLLFLSEKDQILDVWSLPALFKLNLIGPLQELIFFCISVIDSSNCNIVDFLFGKSEGLV